MRFELMLGIEVAGDRVGRGDDRNSLPCEIRERNYELLRMVQLLGAAAAFAAALDRSGNLRKMQHADIAVGMFFRVMSQRARHSLRACPRRDNRRSSRAA